MPPASNNPAFEVVARTGDLCGECPLWLPADQALLWTDINGRRAHRFTPGTDTATLLQTGLEIAGLVPHAGEGYIAVNSGGIHHWDGAEHLHPVPLETSHTLQLNDCVADFRGRLLTGSTFFTPFEQYPLGKLFQVDLDGRVDVLLDGLHLSNGLAFSPHGCVLYVTDSVLRRIHAGDYDQASGRAANFRVLVQVSPADGMPDGLTVDSAGALWSAHWYGGCVVQYSPDGDEIQRIPLPAQQISSVAFGGPDLRDLYITSAAHPEPGPVPTGYVARPEGGGDLYRVRVDTPGLPERPARIPAGTAR